MHSTTKISAPAEVLNLLQMAGLWLQVLSQTSFWALTVWSKTKCCIMEAIKKKKRYSVKAWEQGYNFHLHVASLYFCFCAFILPSCPLSLSHLPSLSCPLSLSQPPSLSCPLSLSLLWMPGNNFTCMLLACIFVSMHSFYCCVIISQVLSYFDALILCISAT